MNIQMMATSQEIGEHDAELAQVQQQMAGYLKELGLA